MRNVFVTGATGFVGTHLVEHLLGRGCRLRVLSRRAEPPPPPGVSPEAAPLAHHDVEIVQGDITDPDSIRRAMEGCSHAFHLAAYAKNWAPDPTTYTRLNVDAVGHVLDAAAELGVQRVVWTSTIMTLGPTPPGVVADESTPRWLDRPLTEYEATKLAAEKLVADRAGSDPPVVIVNPTRVYGPGHLTEGNTVAQLIRDYDRGRMPVLLNGGVNVGNYVYVDDVAQGHLLAMERGVPGERYILGGTNVTLKEFFRAIDRASGRRHFQIPIWKAAPMALAYMQKWMAKTLGIYPRITPGWMRTFLYDWAFSSEKAQQQLGYKPTPLNEGIRRTYAWLQSLENGAPSTG